MSATKPLWVTLASLVGMILHLTQPISTQTHVDFVGSGTSKVYVALKSTYTFLMGINYCHTYKYMSGVITTEQDFKIVTEFLNSTSTEGKKSFWVSGTDHRVEGLYQWMSDLKPIDSTLGNWTFGNPSGNRSVNCLTVNSEGFWEEELCSESVLHYVLCEVPLLQHGRETSYPSPNYQRVDSESTNAHLVPNSELRTNTNRNRRLNPIGGVENKLYFVDNSTLGKFTDHLDYCHVVGMRLAAPESPAQLDFLVQYSEKTENSRNTYALAATDTLSISCSRSNTDYRWFYSGNSVGNQSQFPSNWWYVCLFLYNGRLASADCIGLLTTGTLCELQL